MKILVTGGTGFIGSHIVIKLLELGHDVAATGSRAECPLPPNVAFFPHCLTGIDWQRFFEWLGNSTLDVLIHQAAQNDTTCTDMQEMLHANCISAMDIFEIVSHVGCKRIIYASSCAVYGNLPPPQKESGPVSPMNCYASSKVSLENATYAYNEENPELVIIGLRYSNVYGPGEFRKGRRASMICQMALQMRERRPQLFKNGEHRRDFVFIDDVVRANLLAMECGQSGVVNVGSGKSASFNEVFKILCKVLKKEHRWARPEYIDNPYTDKFQVHTECDLTYAKQLIGYAPIYDIHSGISEYANRGGFIL